jgi:integrase
VGLDVGLTMALLTELKAKKIAPGDKPIGDGLVRGLRLEAGPVKGKGKWILRFTSPSTGRRRDMGLGAYPEVGLAEARARGLTARQTIASEKDPIDERGAAREARKVAAEAMTFEQAARKVHEEQEPGWANKKHAAQWLNTLQEHVFPRIGSEKLAGLTPADFAEVLRPIWLKTPETATRVKQRCHKVMKWSWAHGLVSSNPVDNVGHLLPHRNGGVERVTHQPAMPWRDIPEFVRSKLRRGPYNVSRALLEFVILTASRSGEARAVTWGEVDLDAGVWTVPASRMKAKVVHRVPLSQRALEIMSAQRAQHPETDLVFPSVRGFVLSDMVLTKFLRDHKAPSSEPGRIATAHGFRSSFRDWASENGYPRDLAERALAHTVKNQVEAAYHRTDLLEQRRAMMEAWGAHVAGLPVPHGVVRLRGRN